MKFRSSFLLIALFLITIGCAEQKAAPVDTTTELSTFYFIRHAEKDRSNATNKDPELTDTGQVRALKWNTVFKNISFDAIYSTDYNRTRQTAQPTVTRNNLDLSIYDPRAIDGPAFIAANAGNTVLVVGHSNTTPAFVNAVIGEERYDDIDDSNNANLYIVTISNGIAQSTVLHID